MENKINKLHNKIRINQGLKSIGDKLDDLYEQWLLDNYPEDTNTKDKLMDKYSDGFMRDEFNELVIKSL